MVFIWFPNIDPDAVNVVYIINVVLTLLFIYDFGLRLATAPDRSSYFLRDYGWTDLLAIIPTFRIFRVFRIYKAYRIVRKHGGSSIITYLSRNRAESALYLLVFMVILIIEWEPSSSSRQRVPPRRQTSRPPAMPSGGPT
jgi:voltage-gated potassium channel